MEAPELDNQSGFCSQFANEKNQSLDSKPGGGGDHFIVEDLLDFSNEDAVITDGSSFDTVTGNSTDSSTVSIVESCNSSSFSGSEPWYNGDSGSRNFADDQFSSDLCVPVIHSCTIKTRVSVIIVLFFNIFISFQFKDFIKLWLVAKKI